MAISHEASLKVCLLVGIDVRSNLITHWHIRARGSRGRLKFHSRNSCIRYTRDPFEGYLDSLLLSCSLIAPANQTRIFLLFKSTAPTCLLLLFGCSTTEYTTLSENWGKNKNAKSEQKKKTLFTINVQQAVSGVECGRRPYSAEANESRREL